MTAPEIAIVAPNTLTSLGLQNLLEEIIPMATIRVFRSFAELMDDTPDMYAHYFISSQIYFEHTSFFLPRKPKTIVLAGGDNQPQLSGVPTLNIYQDEKGLVKTFCNSIGTDTSTDTPTSNRTVSAPPCRLMPPVTPMPTSFPPAR